MTPTQILNLVRGRNEDGTLKVNLAPDEGPTDPIGEYLTAIGVIDPDQRAKLKAKYAQQSR